VRTWVLVGTTSTKEALDHVARWIGSESRASRCSGARWRRRHDARDWRPPDRDGLRSLVQRVRLFGEPVRGVIEAMNGARFVHDHLEQCGWEVEIADAARIKGLAPLACKTGRIDGRQAARELWGLPGRRVAAGEQVPDRGGELAGDLDAGDRGATLFATATLGAFVVMPVARMVGGVHRGFDERPAQIARPVLGQGSALVGLAGLVDHGAQAGVAGELSRTSRRSRRKKVQRPTWHARQLGQGDHRRETQSGAVPDGLGAVTELLTSELVSNVARHVGSPITVRALRRPSRIRVEVDNTSREPPVLLRNPSLSLAACCTREPCLRCSVAQFVNDGRILTLGGYDRPKTN
jgi:hypothetical protein